MKSQENVTLQIKTVVSCLKQYIQHLILQMYHIEPQCHYIVPFQNKVFHCVVL